MADAADASGSPARRVQAPRGSTLSKFATGGFYALVGIPVAAGVFVSVSEYGIDGVADVGRALFFVVTALVFAIYTFQNVQHGRRIPRAKSGPHAPRETRIAHTLQEQWQMALKAVVALAFYYVLLLVVVDWSWGPGRVLVGIDLMIVCIWSAISLTSARARSLFFTSNTAIGPVLAVTGFVAITAANAFGVATYELINRTGEDMTNGAGAPADPPASELANYYFWKLADALPGHPLETLAFESPFEHDSHMIGLLVLVFGLLVITPLLRYLIDNLKWSKDRKAR